MKAEFIFHNVGQGLFYSGKISHNNKEFNFVYDCGNKNLKHLKLVIDDYLSYLGDNNIDMLVVSHFHADHISGLDYLLQNRKPKYVFLPYLEDVERLYILVKKFLLLKTIIGILDFYKVRLIFCKNMGLRVFIIFILQNIMKKMKEISKVMIDLIYIID